VFLLVPAHPGTAGSPRQRAIVTVCSAACLLGFSFFITSIGWEEHLQNVLFCVRCNVKP